MSADRNLLFGVLALQADLLDAAQFAEACSAWAARKDTPLGDLLVQRGWLSAADRADVERLLERKLNGTAATPAPPCHCRSHVGLQVSRPLRAARPAPSGRGTDDTRDLPAGLAEQAQCRRSFAGGARDGAAGDPPLAGGVRVRGRHRLARRHPRRHGR
jgi:hypothetical protein